MDDLLPTRDPVTVPVLRAVLTGLAAGHYPVSDLITRYDTWAEREGIPIYRRASPQMLGVALRNAGFGRHNRRGRGVLWTINPERLELILSHAEGTVSETPPGGLR